MEVGETGRHVVKDPTTVPLDLHSALNALEAEPALPHHIKETQAKCQSLERRQPKKRAREQPIYGHIRSYFQPLESQGSAAATQQGDQPTVVGGYCPRLVATIQCTNVLSNLISGTHCLTVKVQMHA
jgi:hypothetical protein